MTPSPGRFKTPGEIDWRRVEAGRLPIDRLITRRYSLDEINEAHRALAAGENARGLIVF